VEGTAFQLAGTARQVEGTARQVEGTARQVEGTALAVPCVYDFGKLGFALISRICRMCRWEWLEIIRNHW
jgi:hypothetical protein